MQLPQLAHSGFGRKCRIAALINPSRSEIVRRNSWCILIGLTAAVSLVLLTSAGAAITATTYPFSSSTGVALEDMSTGTTQLIPANSGNYSTLSFDIGFHFWLDGVR